MASIAERAHRFGGRLDFRDKSLRGLELSHAFLVDADLRDADLSHTDLRESDFRNAHLANADLRGADLRGARNLTIGQLASALTDGTTKLPAGISLAAIEAVREDL